MNDEQALRKVSVDLEDVCNAMDDASLEHRYFLDTESGELILISEMFDENVGERLEEIDAAPAGSYLQVPRAESHEGYRDMEEFIASLDDEHLQELLEVAIQGPGAFRRFKNVLFRHPEERQRWFDFKSVRLETRAREWLAVEGCEPVPKPRA